MNVVHFKLELYAKEDHKFGSDMLRGIEPTKKDHIHLRSVHGLFSDDLPIICIKYHRTIGRSIDDISRSQFKRVKEVVVVSEERTVVGKINKKTVLTDIHIKRNKK